MSTYNIYFRVEVRKNISTVYLTKALNWCYVMTKAKRYKQPTGIYGMLWLTLHTDNLTECNLERQPILFDR